MKSHYLFFSVLLSFQLPAQLSGVYNVPSTFSTLAGAIQSLNTAGAAGPVTIAISAGYTETAPPGGYSLTATGTSVSPITFQKSGTGANPVLTAYSGGNGSPGTSVQDGVWRLIGSDFITINGINIVDPNTFNNGTMEYGIGLFKASATNGCQNNLISNCMITLNRVNNASGSGPSVDGSRGINMVNALATSQSSNLLITSASGSNSYNRFLGNTIQNCNIGIALIGFVDSAPFAYADTGNDVGGTSPSSGNQILNFGGGGTSNPAAGIRTLAQYGLNISYNLIDNNNGSGINHATVLRGIYLNSATAANVSVTNNSLTLHHDATTSQLSAIENLSGAAGVNNTVTISDNLIAGCTSSFQTTGAFYGIYNTASCARLDISGNVFSSNSSNVASGSVYLVRNSGQVTQSISVTGNSLSHSFTGTASATGPFYGIYNSGGTASTSLDISANQFPSVIFANVTGTGALNFIYNTADCGTFSVSGNYWNNLSLNHSAGEFFIHNNSSTQSSLVVSSNTISNISRTASAGNIYCYYSTPTSPGTCSQLFSNNLMAGITATVPGAGSFYGIYSTEGNTAPYPAKTVQGNVLSNISMSGTGSFYGIYFTSMGDAAGNAGSSVHHNTVQNVFFSDQVYAINVSGPSSQNYSTQVYSNSVGDILTTGATATVYGLYTGSTGAGIEVYRNKIYKLSANGPTGAAHGIYCGASTTTALFNNCIGGMYSPYATGTNRCNGIFISGGSAMKVFYNTVLVNAASTGANFGSNALFCNSTPSLTLRNNILINLSVPTGQGVAAAFKRSSANLSTYATISGNNIFYAGGSSAGHLIFDDNSNTATSLAGFQQLVTPREGSSLTESTVFTSTVGSGTSFLHVDPALFSFTNNGAQNINGITADYDSNIRQGNSGYTGTGSAPDIGADEYEQNLPACSSAYAGTISAVTTTVCAGQAIHIQANGFSWGAGTAYQWKASGNSGGPYVNVTTGTGGNQVAYTVTLTPGTYYYILSATCSGSTSLSSQLAVTVMPLPTASASAVSLSVCEGSAICLSGSGSAGSFNWTGPSGYTASVQNPTIISADSQHAGTYSLVVAGNGCSSLPSTVAVSVHTTTLNLKAVPVSHCTSGTSTLSIVASSALSYTWDSGSTAATIAVTPISSTIYSITGTNGSGCNKTSTVSVEIITPTIVSNGGVQCGVASMGTVSANAFTPSLVSWFAAPGSSVTLGTGSALAVSAATTTTYFARASSAAQGTLTTPSAGGINLYQCNMFDIVALSNLVITGIDLQLPSAIVYTVEIWHRAGSFAGNTSSGAGWTLAGTATVSGNGSGIITAIPITFSMNILPGQTGGFYVAASSSLNSTASGPVGTAWVSNNDLQVMSGNAGSYFAVNTPDVGLNGAIRYYKPGCTSPLIAVTLTVQPNPTVTAAVNPTLVCQGDSAILTAAGAAGYTCSAGTGIPANVHPPVTTSYTVTGFDVLGCTDTAIVLLQVLPGPTLVTSPVIPSLCAQSSITLSVSGAIQYTWNTGANSGSIVLSPPGNTVISVSGTGNNSCITTASLAVTVYSIPVINLSDTLIRACENQPVKLSASGGVSYNWNPGNFNTDTLVIIANGTTIYTVTGFDGHCRSSAVAVVQGDPCVGIPEKETNDFKIFPNPCSGNLTLLFNSESQRTIRIYNPMGMIISENITWGSRCSLSFGSFSNGLYHLTVLQEKGSVSRKILIQGE